MTVASPETARRAMGTAIGTIAVLVLLLVPVGFLFTKVWQANRHTTEVVASERAAVTYGRPLNSLLAALVEARTTAARKVTVDDSGIRAAMGEINRLDSAVTDLLGLGQKWSQLVREVDAALSRNASGADAITAYQTPIAMTIALLQSVTDASQVSQDPAGSFIVLDVSLHLLPEAVAAAGELAAIASVSDGSPASLARLGIGRDRLEHLTQEVGHALSSETGPGHGYATRLGVLRPLDEFSSAAADVGEMAANPAITSPALRERIEASSNIVRTAATALANSIFTAFLDQLTDAAAGLDTERTVLLLAAAVILLAMLLLLWRNISWTAMRRHRRRHGPEAIPDTPGRHGRREDIVVRPDPTPQLVDARELINREAADAGRALGALGARKR